MRSVFQKHDGFHRTSMPVMGIVWIVIAIISTAQFATAQDEDKSRQAVEQFNLGQDAHEKGDLPAAIAFYAKAIEIVPEFPEAEFQRGNAYLSLNQLDEAERSFRRAIKLREDWTLAIASLGSLLVARKQFAEAETLLTKALADDASNSLALSALVELRIRSNADEKTLRDLLGKISALSVKARPSASLLSSKAAVEQKLGDSAAAKESATRSLQLDPKLRSALAVSAVIALSEKDPASADGFVRRLEAADQNSEEIVVLRAQILIVQGKKAESIALLAAVKNPSDSTKAMIESLKESDITDLVELEAKILQKPDDADALAGLCVGFRVSDPAKALDYCRRASIVEPNELSHAVNFGAALVQAKRYEEAIAIFRRLLTKAPDNATIRANLATALFQLKRYPEAKSEFRWLTEKQPTTAIAFYFLGITHDHLGEYLDAMANYQQFLKIADPEANRIEIEKVNLRLPAIQKQIKNGKGRKGE